MPVLIIFFIYHLIQSPFDSGNIPTLHPLAALPRMRYLASVDTILYQVTHGISTVLYQITKLSKFFELKPVERFILFFIFSTFPLVSEDGLHEI